MGYVIKTYSAAKTITADPVNVALVVLHTGCSLGFGLTINSQAIKPTKNSNQGANGEFKRSTEFSFVVIVFIILVQLSCIVK